MRNDVPNYPAVPQSSELRLGVIWYLYPDVPKNQDNRLIKYLENLERNQIFRDCDPQLHYTLQNLVFSNTHSVVAVNQAGILPDNTLPYNKRLFFNRGEPRPGQQNQEPWIEGASNAVANADIVYVDPDNGILSPGMERRDPYSPKHVRMDELTDFANSRRKSLVIYHHLSRNSNLHRNQIHNLSQRLQHNFPHGHIWVLRNQYQGDGRAYFVVTQTKAHHWIVRRRLTSFMQSPWGEHFTEETVPRP